MDKKTEKKPRASKPKPEKTEAELVAAYAKKVMNSAATTMVDRKDLHKILIDSGYDVKTTPTMLALDRDFYFSVVFQTGDQKYQFLKEFCAKFKIELENSDDEVVDIVNGIRLSDKLGIKLKIEAPTDYPSPDPSLLPFVLDMI